MWIKVCDRQLPNKKAGPFLTLPYTFASGESALDAEGLNTPRLSFTIAYLITKVASHVGSIMYDDSSPDFIVTV